MTYDKFKDFVYPYVIYSFHNTNFKAIIGIISDYSFDSSKKEVMWHRTNSIFDYDNNNRKMSPITWFYNFNKSSNKFIAQLNDSLFVLSVNNYSHKQMFMILNSKSDLIVDSLDISIGGKEFLFCSDKEGNFLVLDFDKKTIFHYRYNQDKLNLGKTVTNGLSKINFTQIYDILTHNGNIFFVYYVGSDENQLYIDEYSLNEFEYKRGFILNNEKNYTTKNLFFDFKDDGLFVFSSNEDGEWIIENFPIKSDKR